MDIVARTIYPKGHGPIMEIESKLGTFTTFREAVLQIDDLNMTLRRDFSLRQRMTWCGLTEAEYVEADSCYEGICSEFLVSPQQLNLDAVLQALGKIGPALEILMSGWQDNHVALLLNCIRFAHLLDVYDRAVGSKARHRLEMYCDKHISMDSNHIWRGKEEYTGQWKPHWPGGDDPANYPEFVALSSNTTDSYTECVDLTRLGGRGVEIMLMMMGAWQRSSRYKMDFSLPKLANKVAFRSDMPTGWQRGQERDGKAPKLPTSREIWRAMIEYVKTNKVYSHFSVAVYLYCTAACQYIPGSAEEQIWNRVTTRVRVPKFHSIRGKYTFFNSFGSSPINARARSEWIYIATDFKKLQTLAVLICQAMWFGLGVRNMRRGIERNQYELNATMEAFMNDQHVASAAIAETTRLPIPLSGMNGICTYFSGWQEKPFTEPMLLPVHIIDLTGARHYDIVRREGANFLRVHQFNLPGIPVCLLPLPNIIPGLDIFTGKGKLSPKPSEYTQVGWKQPYYKIYELAVVAGLCGYDIKVERSDDRLPGPKEFVVQYDSDWPQPLVIYEDARGVPLYVKGIRQREMPAFICLPQMGSLYCARELEYRLSFWGLGTYRHGRLTNEIERYVPAKVDLAPQDG